MSASGQVPAELVSSQARHGARPDSVTVKQDSTFLQPLRSKVLERAKPGYPTLPLQPRSSQNGYYDTCPGDVVPGVSLGYVYKISALLLGFSATST